MDFRKYAPWALFCLLVAQPLAAQAPVGASGGRGGSGGFGGGRGMVMAEVSGDAKAGEAFFNGAGKCNTCHSATGDLKGVATRMNATVLQGRWVYPRGNGSYGSPGVAPPQGAKPDKPLSATVTTPDGKTVTGDVVTITDFLLTIKTTDGSERTFTRDGDTPKVKVTDPLQGHIDVLLKLNDKVMHDVTAYLVTLK